jgi:hypothetical protein
MENALRITIIFVWCMFFGFFSVMGYLDETMTSQRKTLILVGLILVLTIYLAFEWFTRTEEGSVPEETLIVAKNEPLLENDSQSVQLDERMLRRLHLYTKDNEKELKTALTPEPPKKPKKHALSLPKK